MCCLACLASSERQRSLDAKQAKQHMEEANRAE